MAAYVDRISAPLIEVIYCHVENGYVNKSDLKRLLKKSIHKGQVEGFRFTNSDQLFKNGQLTSDLYRSFDVSSRASASHDNDNLLCVVLRYQDYTNDELLDHLTEMRIESTQKPSKETLDHMMQELARTSDLIEGSTINKNDIAQLDLDITPSTSLSQDKYEFACHYLTIQRFILAGPIEDIDRNFIEQLHYHLRLKDLDKNTDWGKFRTQWVGISSRENDYFAPHQDISRQIDQMIQSIDYSYMHAVKLAAWLHHTFIMIHPFKDGNGRVGRLLMNAILVKLKYPLTSIQPEVRLIYNEALHAAHEIKCKERGRDPYALLVRIIAEATLRSMEIVTNRGMNTTRKETNAKLGQTRPCV